MKQSKRMIPPDVIEWLAQYARPSAIKELWESFVDPVGGEYTHLDLVAAAQLDAIYYDLTGEHLTLN